MIYACHPDAIPSDTHDGYDVYLRHDNRRVDGYGFALLGGVFARPAFGDGITDVLDGNVLTFGERGAAAEQG